MTRNFDTPIFIVGPLRSGTTLLRLLIGNHSQISDIGEFEEAVSEIQDGVFPDIESYHNFLENDRAFQDHNYTIDKSLSYSELVKSFLTQAHERMPKMHVCASIHSQFDSLPVLWPKAKYIHLLRDPRDVSRSCIGMGWVGNVWYGADYWTNPEKRWDNLKKEIIGEDFLEVRFEELVSQPELVLKSICDFLGVEFTADMINIENKTSYSRPDHTLGEQWRRKLSSDQICLIEAKCEDLMLERGYKVYSKKLVAPSFLKRAWLFLQNRVYRWSFNINRLGFKLWLQYNISKRLRFNSLYERSLNKINSIQRTYLK